MSAAREFEIFWGEISPCDHSVQIYEDDQTFLDALEGFIAGGLRNGDAAIVIATPTHTASLTNRLSQQGLDLGSAVLSDQLILLDASETLARFVRDGWPDEDLFLQTVRGILARARIGRRNVRAFGEMVALLWAQGYNGATVRLEHLWHQLCQREAFSLFCAYPRSGFTKDALESMRDICEVHTRMIRPAS